MKKGNYNFFLLFLFILIGVLVACRKEEIPPLSLGILETYQGTRLKPVHVDCALDRGAFEWRLIQFVAPDGTEEDRDEIVSTSQNLVVLQDKVGDYTYLFTYEENNERLTKKFQVQITDEIISYSPYIADVLDYIPAPGRFVNSDLGYSTTPPNSYEEVLARCKTIICGGKINKEISLGGFGGYVIFAFDHTILNIPDVPDFKIYSPVRISDPDPSGDPALRHVLSNSAPGIVWVAFDANNNGRPDEDEWYELRTPSSKGAPNQTPKFTTNYKVTYTQNQNTNTYTGARLDSATVRRYLIPEHIKWEALAEKEETLVKKQLVGYIPKLIYDVNASYWPLWITDHTLTVTGTLLPDNGEEKWSLFNDGTGDKLIVNSSRWVQPGTYADNHPDTKFDISTAVDKNGEPVHLPGIQFVKVQTGVNLQLGIYGSSCTAIQGAVDLHLKPE